MFVNLSMFADDQDFLPMSLDPSSNQPVLFPSQASAVLSPPTDISPPSEDSLSCDSSSLRNSIFTPHSTSTSATRPDRNRAITESQPWIPHGYHHSITGGLVSQSQSSPQLWMPPTQGRVQVSDHPSVPILPSSPLIFCPRLEHPLQLHSRRE